MKQQKFKFASARNATHFLPKMVSRRMGLRADHNHNIAYRSEGGASKEESEDEKAFKAACDAIDKDTTLSDEGKALKKIGLQTANFGKALGDKVDATELKALTDKIDDLAKKIGEMEAGEITKAIIDINEKNEKLHKALIDLQIANAENKDASNGGSRMPKELVTEAQVAKFIEETFVDGTKSANGSIEGGKKTGNNARIVIKAPETMGQAVFFLGGEDTDITAFTGRYVDPTLYKRKRKKNIILDYFDIRRINVPTLLYLVKVEEGNASSVAGDPGHADWILSGAPKPKRSFRVTTGKAEAKKVAIFGTVEDKLLRDVPSMQNWVREDFMDEMKEAINDGLLNNDPDVNPEAPLGLKTNAVLYDATPAFEGAILDPTYIDDILAAIAFMAYHKEEAARVFISSDVYFAILGLKDKNERFQNNNLIYTNNVGELYIAGVPITWCDEEDIPSANVLVIGKDLGFKIYAYGDMVFERGLNGEDFREDKTSFRGYQEFLSFIPENRENSVMYDTWANIETAITKPAV